MDFTPATFKFGNPLEDANNALNTVLLMEKATDLRGKRRRTDARNTLMSTPGVMNDDGSINRGALKVAAVKNSLSDLVPEYEEQWAKDDENSAQTAMAQANVGKIKADTSKTQADDIAKRLESTSKMLGLIQSPQQYVEFITKDPVIGASLAERGMGAEQLTMALGKMSPEQFQRFLVEQRVGADKALQNHYVTANKGGTGGIYQMHQYGAGAPKEVANWKVTENPNHYPAPHWVQDYDPVTKKVTHRPVTGPTTVNPVKAPPTSEDKEILERSKAAAAVVPELNGLNAGQFVVQPGTGDIEIRGAQPMSDVAQRKLDMLAGEFGGQIVMEPGQNPRIVLNPNTTLGTVQSILRAKRQAKNSLTWEVDGNGVKRMVPKAPGVIQMPLDSKVNPKVPAVKLRAQARSQAIAEARTIGIFDQATIDQMADAIYQQYLDTQGAGYGGEDAGTKLMNELKADRAARGLK